MFNQLYVLYNTLSKRYGDVVAYPSDAFASRRISELYKNNPQMLTELELCRVGSISIETGEITPHSPLRITLTISSDSPITPQD